jgi:tetratricopeptide (TPR) repeat protein
VGDFPHPDSQHGRQARGTDDMMAGVFLWGVVVAAEPGAALSPQSSVVVEEELEAVRKAPSDPRARLELGLAYAAADEYEFALAELIEAIRLDPENKENLAARANVALGNVLLALDRPALAANAYREALRLGWKEPGVYLALGDVLTGLGQFEEAIARYREVLRLSPGTVEAHAGLGLALEGAGRLDEAAAHYELYLRAVPAGEDHGVEAVRLKLAKLKERLRM